METPQYAFCAHVLIGMYVDVVYLAVAEEIKLFLTSLINGEVLIRGEGGKTF